MTDSHHLVDPQPVERDIPSRVQNPPPQVKNEYKRQNKVVNPNAHHANHFNHVNHKRPPGRKDKSCVGCGRGPVTRNKGHICPNFHPICSLCLEQRIDVQTVDIRGSMICPAPVCRHVINLGQFQKLVSAPAYKTINDIIHQKTIAQLKPQIEREAKSHYDYELQNPLLGTRCQICSQVLRKGQAVQCQSSVNSHGICQNCLNHIFDAQRFDIKGQQPCFNLDCSEPIILAQHHPLLTPDHYQEVQLRMEGLIRLLVQPEVEREVQTKLEYEMANPLLGQDCAVCDDQIRKGQGLICGNSNRVHASCSDCLGQYIIQSDDIKMTEDGSIKCLGHGCDQRLTLGELQAVIQPEVYQKLTQKFSQTIERRIVPDLEQQITARIRSERAGDGYITKHRTHILEQILTLHCPGCHQAFIDFTGCFALTCSRCKTCFCGWCLQNCGRDAHPHVRYCFQRLSPDSYFGTRNQFQRVHHSRREKELREYLKPLPRREEILEACKQELDDLHLSYA